MKNFLLALVLFTAIVSCDEKINDKDFKTISFEESVPAEDVKGLFTQLIQQSRESHLLMSLPRLMK
ncbi:MAG: hypothetical protein IPP25_21115 [Saprospiraceae bacterium]|nr:hypothetical protein [Candidatus Opimibacter skivensis]